jgi:glycosyltransferase involved in cell wall biosynthesis
MVTTFYPPYSYGGDGITVQRLARALVRAGHDVTVVHDAGAYAALGHRTPAGQPLESDDGVEVVTLHRRHPRLSGLLTHQLGRPIGHAPRLEDVLADGDFDVVHFHNVSLIGGPGALSLAADATVLYTAHEHWLVCPTHILWRHEREPCPARECLRCTLRHRRPPQLWRHSEFFDRQLQHALAFAALELPHFTGEAGSHDAVRASVDGEVHKSPQAGLVDFSLLVEGSGQHRKDPPQRHHRRSSFVCMGP